MADEDDQIDDAPEADDDDWKDALAFSKERFGTETLDKTPKASANSGDNDDPAPAAPAQEDDKAAAPAAAEPDIWASAPEPLQKAYQEAKAAREAAEAKLNRHIPQLNGQNRRIRELEQQLADAAKAPKTPDDDDDPDTDALLTELKDEYPELMAKLAPVIKAQDRRVRSFDQIASASAETAKADQTAAIAAEIEAKHPGYEGFLQANGDKLSDWVSTQPKWLQTIFEANATDYVDADGVAELLTRFKAHIDPPKPENPRLGDRRTRQLDGAAAPAPRGGAVAGEKEPTGEDAIWQSAKRFAHKRYGTPL